MFFLEEGASPRAFGSLDVVIKKERRSAKTNVEISIEQ